MNSTVPSSDSSGRFLRSLVLPLLLLVFVVTLLRTAWITEDAFITFRTVDNFLHGSGLRWNLAERVQTYTHPLWMFLIAAGTLVSGESFYSTLVLGLLCSVGAVLLLCRYLAVDAARAVLCVVLLLFSRAFIDYSTSGMENSLSHLLLALFALVLFRQRDSSEGIFLLSLLTALALTNRMDTGLLLLPALLGVLLEQRRLRSWALMLLGMLPFVLWEVFSLFYYGFLVPNTAYAKLNHGIPGWDLCGRGLIYLFDSLLSDPLTLLTVVVALAGTWIVRDRRSFTLALGLVLYLLYILRIGGDYMSGRFLSAPFFLAVILIAHWPEVDLNPRRLLVLAGLVVVIGGPFQPPVFSDMDFGVNNVKANTRRWLKLGIVDERCTYFQVSSLAYGNPLKNELAIQSDPHMIFNWIRTIRAWKQQQMSVIKWSNVGAATCEADPQMYVIDAYALCDPLLARLPARWMPFWVAGHFEREVPEGYFETLATGHNLIQDPNLARYYDQLRLIIRGDLGDPRRLLAILNMNLGLFDHLVDRDYYRHGPRTQVRLEEISVPRPDGTLWQSPETVVMDASGLVVELGFVTHARQLEISLDFNDTYRVDFYRGAELLDRETVGTGQPLRGGLLTRDVTAPAAAVERGYDRLKITPLQGDRYYGIGHVRLLNEPAGPGPHTRPAS